MNKRRRKSSGSSVTSNLQNSSRRPSKSIDSSPNTSTKLIATEPLDDFNINYPDEIVLVFYDSMLETIIENWEVSVSPDNEVTDAVNEQVDEKVSLKDFKELKGEDLVDAAVVAVKGSEVSLSRNKSFLSKKSSKNLSTVDVKNIGKSKRFSSNKDNINTERLKRKSMDKSSIKTKSLGSISNCLVNSSTNTIITNSVVSNAPVDISWILKPEDEHVKITFKNGNVYEGDVSRKVMHGYGKFYWADGTYYEGDFKDGYPTGKGMMILSDLSYYKGEFCKGLFHGEGVFCISNTPMIYSGSWKGGRKHGKGWLLYAPRNWYEGEWYEDKRQGFGLRQYLSGAVYKGMWHDNLQHGRGTMIFCNNDIYKGEWKNGKPHGYGEYTWNAFLNETFTFPIENIYKGNWENGTRNGVGLMQFGTEGGAKLAGTWEKNLKHGPGVLVCGNGRVIENILLFVNDKPLQNISTTSLKYLEKDPSTTESNSQDKIRKTSLQMIAEQLSRKQSSKELEPNVLNSILNSEQEELLWPKCNPLKTSIHAASEETNFDYYIQMIIEKYRPTITHYIPTKADSATNSSVNKPSLPSHYTETENYASQNTEISKLENTDIPCYEIEEKQLRHTIIIYLSTLQRVYNKYATITSSFKLNFKPVLIRLFMWQMWRDFGMVEKGYSLIDIDLLLNESPCSGFETVHYPFEKIYFWQFLQSLVTVSQQLYLTKNEEVQVKRGMLAAALEKFINECILPNTQHIGGHSLFAYRDMLPIQSVYLLYRSLGEPHTARKFVQATCVMKNAHSPCYLKLLNKKIVKKLVNGTNAVPVGQSILYLPLDDKCIQLSEDDKDPFYKDLMTFRTLGPKKIVQCLTEVCPLIVKDDFIVNMDYSITFLEFYDTLFLCAFAAVDKKKRITEKNQMIQVMSEKSVTETEKSHTSPTGQTKKGQKKKHSKTK